MTDAPRMPLDQALDVLLYGPLGLAMIAFEEFPKVVEKGRARVSSQIMMARMVGEMASKEGQRQATKLLKQSARTLVDLGFIPGPPSDPPPTTEPATAGRPGPEAASPPAENGHDATPGPAPVSDDLAIPGYDSLSASQVVQRLAGLAAEELEAVRAYESAARGRRTILNRIAQLQSGRS